MNILFAVSEALPFIKTGGLADVAGSLPQELGARGHRLLVFLPFYRQLEGLRQPAKLAEFKLRLGAEEHPGAVYMQSGAAPGVEYYFIAAAPFFDRPHAYGPPGGEYADNGLRFIFFCRAIAASVALRKLEIDVVHCHDWQTALLPVFLKTIYRDQPFFHGGSLFTIHNLAYQGIHSKELLPLSGLGWEEFTPEKLEFFDSINFLKGGLVYADRLNTVSPSYSREILNPENGCGLDGVLRNRIADLSGILNGVDYREWDPRHDPFLEYHYRPERMEGKKICRKKLALSFGLADNPGIPLIGMVSRLAEQKGFDLILPLLEEVEKFTAAFVFLGSGDPAIENQLQQLSRRFPGQIAFIAGYDNRLAHLLEAGADLFLMPSRYEPCGLNQMYSLRYGTVPLVRAVGGLNDCIEDFSPDHPRGNGFKFSEYRVGALAHSLERAIKLYAEPRLWHKLRDNGM
ncbi:MAG: glycogen synthase, partial [Deltaproteobacteria bacterium]|nr:glycogen synthase [Deltaproteobacteria bacterium]